MLFKISDNNYCRNPGGEKPKPFCIVPDGTEEFCHLPKCPTPAHGVGVESNNNNKNASPPPSTSSGGAGGPFADPSNQLAGLLGLPQHYGQYVLLGAASFGLLLLIVLFSLVCKTLCGRRSRKKRRKQNNKNPAMGAAHMSNGFLANGSMRKPLAADQQVCV